MLATLAAVALASAGTGCGTGTPPPRATSTPSGSTPVTSSTASRVTVSESVPASPTPPPTDPATVFAADGIGRYLIGGQLANLQAQGLLAGVTQSPTCFGAASAAATGIYAGVITLSFLSGRLVWIRTASDTLVTPAGAKVGMSLVDAQTLYGSRGTLITSTSGSKVFVVRVSATALALALSLDSTNTRVTSISGGEAERLEMAARLGDTC